MKSNDPNKSSFLHVQGIDVTPDNLLQLSVYTNKALTINGHGHILLPSGIIKPFDLQFVVSGTTFGTVQQKQFNIFVNAGKLLTLTLVTPTSAVYNGMCYVAVELIDNASTSALPFVTLVADFLSSRRELTFPHTNIGTTGNWQDGYVLDASPYQVIQITNPAAGAEFSYTVPANTRLQILSFRGLFTTDGNAANRNVRATFDDGTNIFASFPMGNGNLTASKTDTISLFPDAVSFFSDGGITTIPLPNVILLPGYRFKSSTTAIQVGDQWSALWFEAKVETLR